MVTCDLNNYHIVIMWHFGFYIIKMEALYLFSSQLIMPPASAWIVLHNRGYTVFGIVCNVLIILITGRSGRIESNHCIAFKFQNLMINNLVTCNLVSERTIAFLNLRRSSIRLAFNSKRISKMHYYGNDELHLSYEGLWPIFSNSVSINKLIFMQWF